MMIMFLTASGAAECPWLGTTSGAVVLTSKTTSPEFLSIATRRGFGLSVPVLLPLVAHIHEAVLDDRREILRGLVRATRVAEREHELDLEIAHVAAIDL